LQASIGSVTAGALTWAKVIELETDVATANADMGNLAYLTTPGVRGVAKTTVKETGQAQYLWADNMMNGYPCAVSTLVPATLGGGAEHGLIFGNWRDLVIGQWGGIDIVVDPYSLATKAQIQIVANIWVDVAVLHAASFSAMEGVTV
jgi:HK97 family phage major capsid protein